MGRPGEHDISSAKGASRDAARVDGTKQTSEFQNLPEYSSNAIPMEWVLLPRDTRFEQYGLSDSHSNINTSAPTEVPNTTATDNGYEPQPAPEVKPVTSLEHLGGDQAWIICPFCNERVMTRVKKENTAKTLMLAMACCLICVCLAFLPGAAGWFVDFEHRCSKCNRMVALKKNDETSTHIFGPGHTYQDFINAANAGGAKR